MVKGLGQGVSCSEELGAVNVEGSVGCKQTSKAMEHGEGKFCELCGCMAMFYCHADKAHLCGACDASVHSANFIVSWHIRTLLCVYCGSGTSWRSCGPSVRPERAVCHRCVQPSQSISHSQEGGEHDENRMHALAVTSSSEQSENPASEIVRKVRDARNRKPSYQGGSERSLPSRAVSLGVLRDRMHEQLGITRPKPFSDIFLGCKEAGEISPSHMQLWAPSRIVVAQQCGKATTGVNDPWLRLRQVGGEEEGSCITGGSSSSGNESEKAREDANEEEVSCGHAGKKLKFCPTKYVKQVVGGKRKNYSREVAAADRNEPGFRAVRKRTCRKGGLKSGWR
eukprot:TRINITY_DN17378_c0_g1_i1.p1 TRINITY_DN17378_c0_g1~~TRINITY_DN17378_c0_g1_i1.p1  ORF type:complete len:339 (-),score=48.69 TRINITY_DN17378_c0_g1_i1:518-1534(-)